MLVHMPNFNDYNYASPSERVLHRKTVLLWQTMAHSSCFTLDVLDGLAASWTPLSLFVSSDRYEELKGAATLECAACAEYFAGLVVDGSALTLGAAVVASAPFTTFAEARARERERELQFMTGDICGSGWTKRPGHTMCALHTSQIPVEARPGFLCWAGRQRGRWWCLQAACCKA